MSNLLRLPGCEHVANKEPRKDLVSAIEKLLEMAKDGRLRSMICTGFCADGSRMSAFSGDWNADVYSMRGALAWLEDEFADRIKETGSEGGE